MSDNLQTYCVFIASPNDLNEERKALKDIVEETNAVYKAANLNIQLLGWEETLPAMGRPQELINPDVDRADLFIGLLWRKWGSATGHKDYSSGFEEEFQRALRRREGSGLPEICVFFKEVDALSLKDPGEHLQKVMDFKAGLIHSQKLLFAEFKTLDDWRKTIRRILETHLLRQITQASLPRKSTQPQQPVEEKTDNTTKIPDNQNRKYGPAHQEIIKLWKEAGEAMQNGELFGFNQPRTFDRLKVARLGLATASIVNRDVESELLGVHLINLLYKNRHQVQLNSQEIQLVVRTNLGNQHDVAPGWYWMRQYPVNIRKALIYFACSDNDTSVREAAISLCRRLDVPLQKRTFNHRKATEVICTNDEAAVREAGLKYLEKAGKVEDLTVVGELLTDPDHSVRSLANRVSRSILLRENANSYFEDSIMISPQPSDDDISALERNASQISSNALRKGLQHAAENVRIFAARTLASRGQFNENEIHLLNTLQKAEVWQAFYLNRIRAGESFPPDLIRSNLTRFAFTYGLGSLAKVSAKDVVLELFQRMPYERLLPLADFWSEDGSIAYQVLATKHYDKFANTLREDFEDGLKSLKARSNKPEASISSSYIFSSASSFDVEPSRNADFIAAGLRGFALHAEKAERPMLLKFLEDDSKYIRIEATRGLLRAGEKSDSDRLLKIAEYAAGEVGTEAARVALVLSPGTDGAAAKLLKSEKPENVILAIISLTSVSRVKVWDLIGERLYDGDHRIRKTICAYAVKKFPEKQIEKILDNYLTRDVYYYDVVFYLDRVLYASPPLRRIFREDVESFLTEGV